MADDVKRVELRETGGRVGAVWGYATPGVYVPAADFDRVKADYDRLNKLLTGEIEGVVAERERAPNEVERLRAENDKLRAMLVRETGGFWLAVVGWSGQAPELRPDVGHFYGPDGANRAVNVVAGIEAEQP